MLSLQITKTQSLKGVAFFLLLFSLTLILPAIVGCKGANVVEPQTATNSEAVSANARDARSVSERYNGDGKDVMLQGFHWTSQDKAQNGKEWYRIIAENSGAIKDAGFTVIWFPPPSATADREGYLPNQWYDLNTRYGSKTDLQIAINSLRPARSIVDTVINHRTGRATDKADFSDPAFADNERAIVREDECSCGRGNSDSGEWYKDGRDLDHTNASVQEQIRNWQTWLKNEIGFAGWRYDMTKGYSGNFNGLYNDASQPYLSVGEFWDGDRQAVVNWIDATGGKSMAFDFPTRELLKQSVADGEFARLKTADGKPSGVIGWWSAMSVTFIENHDTESVRKEGKEFPLGKAVQGYAYVLTHPGVPCVFWRDFFDSGEVQKQKIKTLIQIRKRNGINSRSTANIRAAENGLYAAIINDKVAVKIGAREWSPGEGWRVSVDGESFAVWEKN
jgi:alpha-amylase